MHVSHQPVGPDVPDWSTCPRPAPIPLVGRYVTLEPLAAGHAGALHAAVCGEGDDDLWTYRPTARPRTPEATAALVGALATDPATVTFALVPAGRTPEGVASLMRIDPAHGVIEIGGILYARSLQRTTAATEAVHLAMAYAFDDLGYRRFEWKCDALNEPSRRAAARLGFAYEGTFRQHQVVKGRNRDTAWFSVTDLEWPRVRAAHLAWLETANFDGAGRQRSKLSVPPA